MNRVTINAQAARPAAPNRTHQSKVYCPMCTHTVEAQVEHVGRHVQVAAGQKCPRCAGALDAGYIFRMDRAA
ncbi:MAG: hypothetical protein ABI823_04520 [Bryobacteraceae bacterium]